MAEGNLMLSFPMFALAEKAFPNSATGMIHFRGFHARQADVAGSPQQCLMLFATESSASEYAAGRPSLDDAYVVSLADKMELEEVLADCRQAGIPLVMIASGLPGQGIVRMEELTRALQALDRTPRNNGEDA